MKKKKQIGNNFLDTLMQINKIIQHYTEPKPNCHQIRNRFSEHKATRLKKQWTVVIDGLLKTKSTQTPDQLLNW